MYPCNVIKDLLPMYYDGICSDASAGEVEIHLGQCRECTEYYNTFKQSGAASVMPVNNPMEQQRVKAVKKAKKKIKSKAVLTVVIFVLLLGLAHIMVAAAVIGVFAYGYHTAEVVINTDISKYEEYMSGKEAREEFSSKWGMDETIFPEKITEDMDVKDYKMVYYNPFDAQYLGYLVVEYEDADYDAEIERLKAYASTDYLGNYGVTGFNEDYTLLAMYADDYQGFVYALTDGEDTVIYVELIFCNYFYDLEYEKYMPAEYFPEGFDATMGNAYKKKMMGD